MEYSSTKTAAPEELIKDTEETATDSGYQLIVWNDEVNTFEWVIETLISVCGHEKCQAEQCSLLIHAKGKYAVKNGSQQLLKPQREAIAERGIGATIEPMP